MFGTSEGNRGIHTGASASIIPTIFTLDSLSPASLTIYPGFSHALHYAGFLVCDLFAYLINCLFASKREKHAWKFKQDKKEHAVIAALIKHLHTRLKHETVHKNVIKIYKDKLSNYCIAIKPEKSTLCDDLLKRFNILKS